MPRESPTWHQFPPFSPHVPTSTSARKLPPLQPPWSPSTVWVPVRRLEERRRPGTRPLASCLGRGGDSLSGSQAVSAPLEGMRPSAGNSSTGPQAQGVAQEAGRLLPGDPPPLGRVILPTPGSDPGCSSHAGHAGTNLSHLLQSRGAGAPSAPWSCRPATPAARTVREASADPVRPALRLPSLLLLFSASSPARGTETGEGVRMRRPPPSSQARLGKEQGSG